MNIIKKKKLALDTSQACLDWKMSLSNYYTTIIKPLKIKLFEELREKPEHKVDYVTHAQHIRMMIIQYPLLLFTKDENGSTPLHWAVYNGDLDLVQEILKNKYLVHVKNKWGQTPLHNAAYSGCPNVTALLLANGAKVNANNKRGDIPLHIATNRAVTEALIEAGSDVGATDNYGNTPLHKITRWGPARINIDIVDSLIKHITTLDQKTLEKVLNTKNNVGDTPLCWARYYGHSTIATALQEAGATVQTSNDNTPLQLTKRSAPLPVPEPLKKRMPLPIPEPLKKATNKTSDTKKIAIIVGFLFSIYTLCSTYAHLSNTQDTEINNL